MAYMKPYCDSCQEQGWNLITIYSDEGISGAKVNEEALEVDRIGFQSTLAALSTQTIDSVIVLNTSRLWRSDIVKVLVHREFKKHGMMGSFVTDATGELQLLRICIRQFI